MEKRKDVHLVCNAHIDPIWQWDWQEGVSATLSTFQTAVRLADKYDYVFCHNEVTVYKYVEEYAPELFKQIQKLVKKGKWHIMGGWYLQPDCNMPTGESFVRQIQEGKRYFMEKFGVFPTTAINFDPFGHTVGLPQIIKKSGQDSYIIMRPYPSECPLPADQFLWVGLDGSTIKALHCCPYSSVLGNAANTIKERVAERKHEETSLILWGVGNHGGGPSDKDLADITKMLKTEPEHYMHSTPEAFFEAIHPTATFDKPLRISNPGCYTSMYRVKKKHALLENELYMTEKMLSVAYARGAIKEYPEEEIHTIAQDLLNAEFHDVLPGTSIQCGEDNGIKYLDHGLLEAEKLKTKAYFALSTECPPAGEGEYPMVFFNPYTYELTENVECEFTLAAQNWDPEIYSKITVKDEAGNEIKFQRVKEESVLNLDWRKRIVFQAKLKPLALTRYSVYIRYDKPDETEIKQNFVYDDGRKYVEIDAKTGLLKKYAIDGVTYAENAFQLVAFDDNEDPWGMGAFQQPRLGENEEQFTLSDVPMGVFKNMKSVQVIEDGDIYLGIEAFFEYQSTRARIGYKIYKNNDFVDVNVDLFMGDINKIIKLKVPMSVEGKLVGQAAFGTEDMYMDARENVAHRFIALETGDKALALMNNGVYGSHFENGAFYQSLVRGVTYCAHPIEDRPLIPADKFTKKIDQGEHNFFFRLGVVNRNELDRRTQEFVQKPYGLNIFPIACKTNFKSFNVSLSDDTITMVTMKKADGGKGILLRLHNNTPTPVSTSVRVNDAHLPLMFGKFEVKTVLYEKGSLKEIDQLII